MTVLFNLTLETTVIKLEMSGYIGIKSTQFCAYANDVVIICRSRTALKDRLEELDTETSKKRLRINENKIK